MSMRRRNTIKNFILEIITGVWNNWKIFECIVFIIETMKITVNNK